MFLKFLPIIPINNSPALVLRKVDKPLTEPIVYYTDAHIYIGN